jgi:hypothetical protein
VGVIAYDTEFLEDGRTIELISIGMITEDGREYYAVNSEMPVKRIFAHKWLMENVVPSLPLRNTHSEQLIAVDVSRTEAKPRQVIANEVRDFILATPDPELWAWYAAYDHVALCQLWGSMIDLPDGVPMWTNDLKQEVQRLGNPALPALSGITEHNALDDAREVMFRLRWLRDRSAVL